MASRYGLSIRAADPGDAEGLVTLFRASGLALAGRGLEMRLGEIHNQNGAVLLATEWGPPTGVIAIHWHWTLATEMKVSTITAFVVDPDQRRRGVGRLLLKAASQAARSAGCGDLRLSASAGNDGLLAFCLATGFADDGSMFARALRKHTERRTV